MVTWLGFDVFAYEIRKFMCVLTHGWHTYCSTPVEVKICKFVCKSLQYAGRETGLIVYDIVGCGVDSSLTNTL